PAPVPKRPVTVAKDGVAARASNSTTVRTQVARNVELVIGVLLFSVSSGISVLAPNSPALYPPLGTPAHKYFLWPGPGLGTGSRLCQCESRNCSPRPSHPVLSDTPPSPLGSGSISRPPAASAIPPEATARRSAGAYCQTTVSSDGSPPTTANNS